MSRGSMLEQVTWTVDILIHFHDSKHFEGMVDDADY